MPRHASARRLHAQRLLAVVLLATLAWTLPPLMPWLHGPPLAGWPRWAWALFGSWALLVAVVALLVERGGAEAAPADAPEPPP
jgi:hypothetical protein